MEHFDVVVVGARCAGAPLARILTRRGLRVCVLDRARFPSETPSTHVIQPCGVRVLERLGVLDAVLASGAVPIERFTLISDDVRIDASPDRETFGAPGLCVRRVTLDVLLVEAAAAAGAEVRTGCRVSGLMRAEDGRVVGVRTTRGEIGAGLVVGADGRHSTVARSVNAAEYHVTPGGRMMAWGYFEGVGDREGRLRLGRRGELAFLASPTDSGLYLAGIAPAATARREFNADRDRVFASGLAAWPELADLLSGARRVGPIRVLGDWHGYFRQSAGPGWVLVGDAGHFKDFTPGQGISDALRQAERLADAIATGSDLRSWWRWRDEDAYEMYWFAVDMGLPGPPSPLVTRVLRDIAADRDATRQLVSVLNHDVRPSHLFSNARMAASAVRALRDRPDRIWATTKEITATVRGGLRRSRQRRLHSIHS